MLGTDSREASVETALVEKVQRLERFIEMCGPLRLRETALLYVGSATETQFAESVKLEFGSVIAEQLLRHVFVLNTAPLSVAHREALRSAFNGWVTRW